MLRFLQINTFVFITLQISFAQQLEFPKWGSEPETRYYSTGFRNRYTDYYPNHITLKNTELYKEHKVKKILIYDPRGKLKNLFELDSAGKIIRQGSLYHYFTVYSATKKYGEESVQSYAYYQDSILVRTDTIFHKIKKHEKADTAMAYKEVRTKVYKIGFLVNEQNRYYNDNFYKKHFNGSSRMRQVTYYVRILGIRFRSKRGLIFLKKKLKCDYDSMNLYFCSETYYNSNFYAQSENKKKEIDPQKELSNHPFYLNYLVSRKNIYNVEGENFQEPTVTYEVEYCGGHYYNQHQMLKEQNYHSSEIESNQKGLYESYYQLYYPEDRSNEAKELVKKQQASIEEAKKNGTPVPIYSLGYGNQINYPRSKTPVKTLLWKISYEYF